MDYKELSGNAPPAVSTGSKRWWELPEREMADAITGIITFLGDQQSDRDMQDQISARLYGNMNLVGSRGVRYAKSSSAGTPFKDRLSFNIVQSCIDTVQSKIAKNKPKPLFLTSGGDYKIQRRAKKLDKFVEGVFYENQVHANSPIIFRDACVFGTGCTYVYNAFNRVKHERVYRGELLVDETEAFYGDPRSIHRVKDIDRDVLREMFPANEFPGAQKLITNAPGVTEPGVPNLADLVRARVSWHLPSGPDANDGRWAFTLENGTLEKGIWDKPYFPFAFFHWNKRLFGFWGQSAAEQLQDTQLEINKLLWIIQRSFHLAGSFKILLETGSKVVKEHINNDVGAVINYTGTEPKYIVPPVCPPEYLTQVQTLIQRGYQRLGVSELSAASKKPDGLDSGKALREYNDIESDRFMTVGQAYEQYHIDLGRLDISVGRDIYKDKGKFAVKVPGKKFVETIDWKDVDMEDDQFIMKVFPISSLPNDPSGRLSTIQEYAQAGYISARVARRVSDFPDIERVEDMENAGEDYLHEILTKMVDDGEYTPPEPFDKLDIAKELVLEYYAYAKLTGVEEEKLDLLREFNAQVDALTGKATAPPQPSPSPGVGPSPGATPQALPMAPPQSDLLPNAPGV